MYYNQSARLAIYAQGEFGKGRSKTAEGVIRYGKNPVAAVIDKTEAGKKVHQVVKIASDAPIVESITDSLPFKPDALLLGTAWIGGHLPPHWRPDILNALESGLDIINGLHDFLSNDEEIAKAAKRYQCQLIDVRRPPESIPVASGKAIDVPGSTVLTVGSDCSVGKMTASLELARGMEKRGYRSKFQATGQTGIMIEGHGMPIDRVIGDFMAGAAEQLILEAAFDNEYVFLEGQGSLLHPGFSGVTLSILHGSAPKALVLCHRATQTHVEDDPRFLIPPLSQLAKLYELTAGQIRPSKVVGICLNTYGLDEESARKAVEQAEAESGLPACDPVRFGVNNVLDALIAHQEEQI